MLGMHGGIEGLLKDRERAAQLCIHFVGPGQTLLSSFSCFSHKVEDKPSPMVTGCDSQPKFPCPGILAWAALLESETAVFHWLQMYASKEKGIR